MPSAHGTSAPSRPDSVVDRSDDETPGAGPSGQTKSQRIAKACDRCRKSKSKCEPAPTEGDPCRSCAATGSECTYTAPTFRRGPPKGYIQTLEHRLHQVESVLAAIMSSPDPRSQAIIDELGKDELASYILETVDTGPFGKTGREKRTIDTSKDNNFFASIVTKQPKALSHRSRRQSRATREGVIETVIATDPQIQTTRPTLAWQDRLSARLARASSVSDSVSLRSVLSPPREKEPPQSSHGERTISAEGAAESEPPRAKRRLVGPAMPGDPPRLTARTEEQSERDVDDLGDRADAFGNLSIDENREVRYHGNSSGLQLLAQTERSDGRHTKGIWRFPMARFWTRPNADDAAQKRYIESVEQSVNLPPIEVQDHLVQVYFTYVNPAIPVVDKEYFMRQYNAQKYGYQDPEDETHASLSDGDFVRPGRPQKLSMLLRLSMYAYAATLIAPKERDLGDIDEASAEYARCARMVLDAMYHESRGSTVQALILLGMREFGIGCLEAGWLHIGMATRMALDLGLNRDSDHWMHNGRELFSEQEKTIRKRIWWACCLADKFSALFLGRTIGIYEGDISTPMMDVPDSDVDEMWRPCAPDPLCNNFTPVPAMYMGYFRHISSLYVIAGEVLAKIYRVSRANLTPSRALREQLYKRLLQWAVDLPDRLNYSIKSNKSCPAPHILAMHIQYWAIVLLAHRPFIPRGSDLARADSSLETDPVPWESYDICQSAANQISSFGMLYQENYDMRWAPPFLSNCFQAAGIMHIVTLRYKPLDTKASFGLQECVSSLAGMQSTWPTALRVRHLIQNAKVVVDQTFTTSNARAFKIARQKPPARVAFAEDQQPAGMTYSSDPPSSQPGPTTSYGDLAHAVPVQYSSSTATSHAYQQAPHDDMYVGYMPGYDSWWPVLDPQPDVAQVPTIPQSAPASGVPSLSSQEFTFGTQHFSPDFLRAMRNPVIHFPSAFHHWQY